MNPGLEETGKRRPKIAFYTQGFRTPSSRFRVEQLLPGLRDRGLDCSVYAANPSNQGETRHWSTPPGPLRVVLRLAGVPRRLCQLPWALRHDVIVFQKPLLPFPSARLERSIARKRPCVFDLDDALYLKTNGRRWIRDIIEVCERIIVGNQHLADQLGAPERTVVVPTVVDTLRYQPRPPPQGRFTIGWSGSAHNLRELEPLVPVLESVLRHTKGRLLLVAERFDASWLQRLHAETVQWSPRAEVEALGRMHVGIMPLADTEFNRGKCAFKLIQYMARGIPVVASPVGANRDVVRPGTDGFLASAPSEWADALHSVYSDPDAALSMGRQGRERVESEYSVSAVIGRYVELFRSLSGRSDF
ncbi:MAG: glycosyltransferase family 4 protein [Deltaproteobacteria bacterium]